MRDQRHDSDKDKKRKRQLEVSRTESKRQEEEGWKEDTVRREDRTRQGQNAHSISRAPIKTHEMEQRTEHEQDR